MTFPSPRLDSAQLEKVRRMGGGKLIVQLIDLMLETGPSRWKTMRKAVEEGCWDEAARGAHSLQSSVGNLGARWLMEKLAVLESEMRRREKDSDKGDAVPDLEEIDLEFQAVLHFLESERGRLAQ